MKPTLTELAIRYGSDKLYAHSYISFYQTLFHRRTVKRLLEIGIGYRDLMQPFTPKFVAGSSLWMWHEYWPDAGIFACDIREDTLINDDEAHIWSTRCDQSSPADLRNLVRWSGGAFDVIIDDGSHEPAHQIITATVLLEQLRDGGVYIIEDCRDPESVVKQLGMGQIFRFNKRPDDCLIVIEGMK